MHYSPEPMRRGKTKRTKEYLPNPAMYVSTPPLVEPKEAKPKRKRVVLSRHFAENFIAGLGFAGGVFVFVVLTLWLISGKGW